MAKKEPHEKIFDTLVKTTHTLRDLEAKYPALIRELHQLENDIECGTEALKKACRGMGTPGETVAVIDGPDGSVRVVGVVAGPTYDYEYAVSRWGRETVKKVQVIDSKRVAALIELGELDGRLAAEAEKEREALTPRVIVRVE